MLFLVQIVWAAPSKWCYLFCWRRHHWGPHLKPPPPAGGPFFCLFFFRGSSWLVSFCFVFIFLSLPPVASRGRWPRDRFVCCGRICSGRGLVVTSPQLITILSICFANWWILTNNNRSSFRYAQLDLLLLVPSLLSRYWKLLRNFQYVCLFYSLRS